MVLNVMTVGDPHFKTSNVMEMKQMCTNTILLAKEKNPDIIVILGDVLDTHERIHVVPLTQSIIWMQELSLIAPVFVLIGNHDRPNNSDFLSNLHPYNGLDINNKIYNNENGSDQHINAQSTGQATTINYNITVVYKVMSYNINGLDLLFVPYVPPNRFMEAILTYTQDIHKYSAIFAHQEFINAKMGAFKSVIGDKWKESYPFVVSGHIHDYDHLQSNIVYTGTPIQHAFGDTTNKTISYYTFLKTEDNDINTEYLTYIIPNHKNIYVKEERIDLKLPKKRIFYINCDQVSSWDPPNDGLIKIVIRGTPSEIKSTLKLKIIKGWEDKGIKVVPKAYDEDSPLWVNKTKDGISYSDPKKIKISSYYDDLNDEIKQHDKYVKYWHKEFSSSIINKNYNIS